MRQRKIVSALILMLCATVFLSGTLLILHTEHECHHAECSICMALQREEIALYIIAMLVVGSLALSTSGGAVLWEDRYLPDWTPVRRKVKLLN